MTRIYGGTIKSATIQGRTYEVFDAVIEEANAKISEAGQSLTTGSTGSSLASAMATIEEIKRSREPWTITVEMQPMGIRSWRMLTTGRPRPPRAETKRNNRRARRARRKLKNLASLRVMNGPEWFEGALWVVLSGPGWTKRLPHRVSVPRSLRPLLGRYIGGGR